MKISIALSLLILALGSVLGWQDHQRHATLGAVYDRLVAEAAHAGITLDRTQTEHGMRQTKREREREREKNEVDAKNAAAELIAFAKELEAMEKKGLRSYKAIQAKSLKFSDSVMSLNVAQLKLIIAEICASPELTKESQRVLISFPIMRLANHYPQTALAVLTESPDFLKEYGMGKGATSTSLAKWAKDDPAAALEWVRANSAKFSDLVDDDAKCGMLSGTAVSDPQLAFKLIAELGLKDRAKAIGNIANAAKNPEERTATLTALRAYLTTLPEGEMRDQTSKWALQSLAQAAVSEGFEAGSKWIASTGPNLENLVESSDLFYRNHREESGKWIEWIGVNLPAEKSRGGISTMVRRWTENDYQAAGKWLAATPDSPSKNISIRYYAETVAKHEPESAAQWAMTLPPGQDRDETLKNIYQKWPGNDDAAKQAFRKSHGIQ